MTALRDTAAARLVAVPSLPRARLVLETAREIDRLVVDDGARTDLVWVRVLARTGPPVVVVTAEDAGRVVSPASVLARLAADGPDRQWTTSAAGAVRWIGPVVRARGEAGGLAATATNDVQAVDVDGRPAVLKVYRVLGSDHGEGRVLAALADGYTPRPVAQVTYRPPGVGLALPLALVTERVPGRTLDVPLRESLQYCWSTGRPRLDPGTETVLTCVRSALTGFHAALDLACGSRVTGDPGAVSRARREALRAEIRALARDSPAVARRAAQRTRTGISAVLAVATATVSGLTSPDPAPAHGDLHLAHVLVGRDRISFVDVAQPGPGGSPADDCAALRRAVECLALDMLIDRAAAAQSRTAIEVVDDLLATALAVAGTGGPGAVLGPLASVVPRELTATRAWLARVCDLLDPMSAGGTGRLPYLARLVHELRHHTDRGDRYHTGLAWCHLVQACSHLGPRPYGTPLREELP